MTRREQELEVAFFALCKAVERDALRIVGMCGNGRIDAAGEAAVSLADTACTAREQMLMTKEQATPDADKYSLKTLPRP